VHSGSASALAPQDVVPPADETAVLGGEKASGEGQAAQAGQAVQASGTATPEAPAVAGAGAQPAQSETAATAAEAPAAAPAAIEAASVPGDISNARQLILVAAPDWGASRAGLARYERAAAGQPWKRVGSPEACSLGRNGLAWGRGLLDETGKGAQKKEGDGKTPAGAFTLPGAFGSMSAAEASASGVKLPFTQITKDVVCVTDPDSAHFNQLADKGKADWKRNDRMYRDSGVNELGALIGHNLTSPAPKAGSCVLLNIAEGQGKPTGGSIGCSGQTVKTILSWLDPRKEPVLVVLPQKEYDRLRPVLGLP